jgi:putative mycofactocin binding protein MftB
MLDFSLFCSVCLLMQVGRVIYPRRLTLSHLSIQYQLIPEVKIRRESFGGILYKYGCADRGALSFINSPQLIELLIAGQQQHDGDVSAAIESSRYSEASKQKLYQALDDLVKRGYIQVSDPSLRSG